MANITVRQSKLKRLVFQPQATIGVSGSLSDFNASTLALPVENVSMSPSRGPRIISRASLLDGYQGAVPGVAGGFGWALSFDMEMHDVGSSNRYPYWAQVLLGCGFDGTVGAGTVTFAPTTKEITNWSSPTTQSHDPVAIRFGLLENHNDNSADTGHLMYDSTGIASWQFTSGERAIMSCEFVGRVANDTFVELDQNDLMATGSYAQVSGSPFVVKSINATIVDNTSSTTVATTALSTFQISSNSETPDVPDPTDSQGFAISPVFWNDGATVSFTVANTGGTNGTEDFFLQRFLSGGTFDAVIGISGSSGRTLEFRLPYVQFTDVTDGDNNGYMTYDIQGTAVRSAPGADDNFLQITWRY